MIFTYLMFPLFLNEFSFKLIIIQAKRYTILKVNKKKEKYINSDSDKNKWLKQHNINYNTKN